MSEIPDIIIHLTIDVDPDDATVLKDVTGSGWSSLIALENLMEYLSDQELLVTLFLRFDHYCRHYFGKTTALFDQNESLWMKYWMDGHELAWHIHLYRFLNSRWNRLRGKDDDTSACKQLQVVWEEIQKLPIAVHSVRIGESYATTRLIELVDSFSLRVDSSALPQRVWKDDFRWIDWGNTRNSPYYPSRHDHRRVAQNNEPSFSILEIPMTTAEIKAPYDQQPVARYVNPAYKSDYFEKMIKTIWTEYRSELSRPQVITLILHPYELLSQQSQHPLIGHGLKQVIKNITYMQNFFTERSISCQYNTLNQTASIWQFN